MKHNSNNITTIKIHFIECLDKEKRIEGQIHGKVGHFIGGEIKSEHIGVNKRK